MAAKVGDRREESEEERFTFFLSADSPFSQWHPSEFTVDGVTYDGAEQFMMHQKAVLFSDADMAARIMACHNPQDQQTLGRNVKNFDRDVWKSKCRDIVKRGNMAKFAQNPEMRSALLATRGTTLVEASPQDRVWSIGLLAENPQAHHRDQWRGSNWLGQALTEVREEVEVEEKRGAMSS